MRNKLFALAMLLAASVSNMNADALPLPLKIQIPSPGDDDTPRDNERPRMPIMPPYILQEGHTLYLYSGCTGATLRLLDADEEEVFCTEITDEMDEICIPSTLVGTYRLEIIRGAFTFYCYVEL